MRLRRPHEATGTPGPFWIPIPVLGPCVSGNPFHGNHPGFWFKSSKNWNKRLANPFNMPTLYSMSTARTKTEQTLQLARTKGLLRPQDLVQQGIPGHYLWRLAEKGLLMRVSRGLYAPLDGGDWSEHHSLAAVARKAPGAVIGLLSALRFHDLGTAMPHEVWIFIDHKARAPKVDYPRLRVFRCQSPRLREGIEVHRLDGVEVAITAIPRTVADCFKHRSKVGLDVALEALREALRHRRCTPTEVTRAAQSAHVWTSLRPYLEAIL